MNIKGALDNQSRENVPCDISKWINARFLKTFLRLLTLVNRVFSHDFKAAMLVSQNNPLGAELFSYANASFCSNKFA